MNVQCVKFKVRFKNKWYRFEINSSRCSISEKLFLAKNAIINNIQIITFGNISMYGDFVKYDVMILDYTSADIQSFIIPIAHA